MKNKKGFIGIIALTAVVGLSMVSCMSTTSLKEPVSGIVYNIAIPAKDIQIVGIVRVETTVDNMGNGELITYDALLKEAEAKGGNGIANIMIDRMSRSTFTTTWYGSALAITFTNENLPSNTHMSPIITRLSSGIGIESPETSIGDSTQAARAKQAAPKGIRQ